MAYVRTQRLKRTTMILEDNFFFLTESGFATCLITVNRGRPMREASSKFSKHPHFFMVFTLLWFNNRAVTLSLPKV